MLKKLFFISALGLVALSCSLVKEERINCNGLGHR